MFIDHFRHTARRWPVRHPFKHQRGGTARQRAINQIAVSCYPADIGGTPVNVILMIIKDELKGGGGINQITAGGMQHAFGFAGKSQRYKG